MIYRGEIYYGPEKKSLFVVYGTYENVGKALGMADTYIRMTRKYKYVPFHITRCGSTGS